MNGSGGKVIIVNANFNCFPLTFVACVVHIGQLSAGRECVSPDGSDAVGDGHAAQAGAGAESAIAYVSDTVRDDYVGQISRRERILPNSGNAVWDDYAGQTTRRERAIPDGGDAAGDGHTGQVGTSPKRRSANDSDTVRDGHAG